VRQLLLLGKVHKEREQLFERFLVLPNHQTVRLVNDDHWPRVARLALLLGVLHKLQVCVRDGLKRRLRVLLELSPE
jgi:hypothetical protein